MKQVFPLILLGFFLLLEDISLHYVCLEHILAKQFIEMSPSHHLLLIPGSILLFLYSYISML